MYTPPSDEEILDRIKSWIEEVKNLEEQRKKDNFTPISGTFFTDSPPDLPEAAVSKLEEFQSNLDKPTIIKSSFLGLFHSYCAVINENILKLAEKKGNISLADSVESIAKLLYQLDLGIGIVFDLVNESSEESRKQIEYLPIEFESAVYRLQSKRQALLDYLTPFEIESYRPKVVERFKPKTQDS